MLSNAYFLAKFRFDTAENEPAKNLQNFRKMHFSKLHFRKMHFSSPGTTNGYGMAAMDFPLAANTEHAAGERPAAATGAPVHFFPTASTQNCSMRGQDLRWHYFLSIT